MKDSAVDDTVIDRLRYAIANSAFPKAAADYAQHLLQRLAQPVRVSIFGLPNSGKSELINMFVGRPILHNKVRLPTTEVVYGASEAMIVTDVNGKSERHEKIDFDVLKPGSAAFLKIELPIETLKRISFLEVVTDGSMAELSSAVEWGVRRTDIALWCSQSFGVDERAVWARVPDSLKDHAFLVLTKADVLSAEKVLSKRVSSLETIVAEEFHSLFAVATLQAIAAHKSNGEVEEAMYHASGGGALASEVLRHAERGRRADFDSAQMFLVRYNIKETDVLPASAEPVIDASVVQEDVPIDLPEANVDETPELAASEPVETSPPRLQLEPLPQVSNVAIFADAIRFLKRRGETLSERAENLGEGNVKDILNQCVDGVEYLMDLFSQDDSGCEAADAFIDDLAEAQDVIVLMQVESGDAPAADAVTLLLQLRREMEMQLAA